MRRLGWLALSVAIVQSLELDGSKTRQLRLVGAAGSENSTNYLFAPFVTETGGVSMALDGGAIPVFGAEIPEISFKANESLQPLQVALLNDWTCPTCLELHARLNRIYTSSVAESLPAIQLRLLPAFSDPKAEAVHRVMLGVHFGTGNPEIFPEIAEEIATGALHPDAASIRARLAKIDPATESRWETLPTLLERPIARAFSLADSQMRRNSSHLKLSTLPQLTVFDAVLAGSPSDSELVEFLRAAALRQQALLKSPNAPRAPIRDQRCDCEKSGKLTGHVHNHFHQHLKETVPAEITPILADGPQIKFDVVSLSSSPIAMGEKANASFSFTNSGNAPLVIEGVNTGCGCVVAHNWSQTVLPGKSGQISFTYDTTGKQDAGLGEHVRHVWVASNALNRTDAAYGDLLEIKVLVTASAAPATALSMTSTASTSIPANR